MAEGPAGDGAPGFRENLKAVGRVLAVAQEATRRGRLALLAFLMLSLSTTVAEAGAILLIVGIAGALASGEASIALDVGPVSLDSSIAAAIGAGFGVTAVMIISGIAAAALSARLAADTLATLRRMLVEGLLFAAWENQSSVSEARYQDMIAVHAHRIGNMVIIVSGAAAGLVGFLVLATAALLVNVVTAVALMALGFLLAVAFAPLVRAVRARSSSHITAHHAFLETASNAFRVLPEVRVYDVQVLFAEQQAQRNLETASQYRRMMLQGRLLPVLYRGSTVGVLLLSLALARGQQALDFAVVGAVVLFLLRGLQYSQKAQSAWQSAMEQVPYLEGIEATLSEWRRAADWRGTRPLDRIEELRLQDVEYRYPTGEVGVSGIDLTIGAGEIVGIDGPSGSGKSTIGQVLLGLRRPTGGTYFVNGIDGSEYDESTWFRRFAYVAQDSRLIEGTIEDNVRFLRDDLTDETCREAMEVAGLLPDLEQWPEGVAHAVGIGGRELSGGQRQRIAIARALAADPDVVIMDEPTSALDAEAEQAVHDAIERLRGRTTVVVFSHRGTTLNVCDRVLSLRREGGGLVERSDARS